MRRYLETLGDGIGAVATRPYACVDWVVFDDTGVRELVEIKCRSHAFGTYPDVLFEPKKREQALIAGQLLKVPVKLMVGWMDVIGIADLSEAAFSIAPGGRWDRGAANDNGMKAHVPINQFHILSL